MTCVEQIIEIERLHEKFLGTLEDLSVQSVVLQVKVAALAIRVEKEQPEILERVASCVSKFTEWLNEVSDISARAKKFPTAAGSV